MALEQCPNNYCGNNKKQIDGDCHDLDYQAGNKIIIQAPPMPRCWCICSCLAKDTPISTPDGTILVQDIIAGKTTVLAAGRDLSWNPTTVQQWSAASPGKWIHVIYVHYKTQEGEQKIVVTRDHLFLLKDGRLKPADRLAPRDQLVDRDNQAVPILDLGWGQYAGDFYEFATKMEHPNKNLDNHLIISAGVVTPDFAVQVYQNDPTSHIGQAVLEAKKLSSVGSPEWHEEHAETLEKMFAARAKRTATPQFKQADPDEVQVPEYASNFLPHWQAKQLQKSAPKKPFSDPFPRQQVEYLQSRFKCLYPEVSFHFNWYDPRVNSFSWVDDGSNLKNVYFSGGLARILGFEIEGMALAFAHELGHLYGKDVGPSGVTCEGEADYYGGKIVLRKYWFGEEYYDGMDESIAQFNVLVGYLQDEGEVGNSTYPTLECRRETFAAAEAMTPKPECAACLTPELAGTGKTAAKN